MIEVRRRKKVLTDDDPEQLIEIGKICEKAIEQPQAFFRFPFLLVGNVAKYNRSFRERHIPWAVAVIDSEPYIAYLGDNGQESSEHKLKGVHPQRLLALGSALAKAKNTPGEYVLLPHTSLTEALRRQSRWLELGWELEHANGEIRVSFKVQGRNDAKY